MEGINLIERYVYEVTQRLPEDERNEVNDELKSEIYDMLPVEPDEAAVKKILQQMGSPIELAGRYRQIPQSLMCPAALNSFLRALKVLIPYFVCFFTLVGIIFFAFQATYSGSSIQVRDVLVNGVWLGLKTTAMIFVCICVGYIIAALSKDKKKKDWKVEELLVHTEIADNNRKHALREEIIFCAVFPLMGILIFLQERNFYRDLIVIICIGCLLAIEIWDIYKIKKEREVKAPPLIPEMAGSKPDVNLVYSATTECAFVTLFSIIGIWLCVEKPSMFLDIWHNGVCIGPIFDSGFLAVCIPAIAVMGTLKTIDCVLKMIYRRWTRVTYTAHILSSVGGTCVMFYLLLRPAVFSESFASISKEWLKPILSVGGAHPLIGICAVIVSAAFIIDCFYMIHKIFSTRKASVSSFMKA